MKKRNKLFSLITLILALAFPLFADASTIEFNASDVKPGTYIVGNSMFTNDGEALTIEKIMFAITGKYYNGEIEPKMEDMLIYYKDFNNNWVSGSNGEGMAVDQTFEIEYIDDREVKGTISGGNGSEVNESTITLNEDLKWYNHAGDLQNGRLAGNYSKGIKITAPTGYTEEYLQEHASVKIDDREAMSWDEVTFGDEDIYFVYYPRFIKDKIVEHTVTVTWEKGNVQVFKIELGLVNFEDAPQGTIDGNGDVTDNTITLTGTSSWKNHDGDLQNGRLAGNYISGVRFDAPEGYTREYLLAHATVQFSDRDYSMSWNEVTFEDEDTFFVYWPRFIKDEITSHTIEIKWEDGNVQTFIINLDDGIELVDGPSGTIEGHGAEYDVDDNTITIDGDLKFNPADEDLQNGRKEGYYSKGIKFIFPEEYDLEYLKEKATVKFSDRSEEENPAWKDIMSYEEEGANYFIYWPRFDIEVGGVKEHTVTIEWEPGNVQEFKIVLGEVNFVGGPEDSVE